MYADYSEKLAKLIVRYSVDIQPSDLVMVQAPIIAENPFKEVFGKVLRAGGHILRVKLSFGSQEEIFYNNATNEQLQYVDDLEVEFWNKADVLIAINSDYNTRALTNIAAEKKVLAREARKEINNIYFE